MICLHDSSEVIARTQQLFRPMITKRILKFPGSFNWANLWCWLKIIIIKTKFTNLKKWQYFIKVKFRRLLAVIGPRGGGGGGSHIDMVYVHVPAFWGHFFVKFGIAMGGGDSSETKEPKLHKLGVFWANYCKKHPIWSKLGAFLSKMVYWWVGNLAKNWYRDSQIFEVRQAHPRTILVKDPPPPGIGHYKIRKHYSTRFGRYCVLSNHRESIYFAINHSHE